MSKQHDSHDDQHSDKSLGMGSRGVSRPMAEQQFVQEDDSESHDDGQEDDGQEDDGHDDDGSDSDSHDHDGGHHMSHDDRLQMLSMHHKQTLWIYWTLVMLGFWLILSPATFGYMNPELWVDPSGGRGVWFSDQTHTALRASLMKWSDILCGIVLLICGWRSLQPNRPYSLWTCCFVGVWLTMAPIFFWAPTVSAYLNDTLVGAWVIALTILIPGMPNMIMYMQHGPPTPPGWTYNPSSWPQRWIMIVTGFAGWLVSRYLAMFQLGYIPEAWDPFFRGTPKVLNSSMSHMWPISDAGLGGISYTFEFLMGFMGSPSRWRTMPWMVAFFGILVIPLGLTHILLVISQPVVVHEWCTLCLVAAMIMLPMIPLEVDEVVAMFQHLRQARQRGDRNGSTWTIFWKGGKPDDCTKDERSPEMMELPDRPWAVFKASIWGMSFPWTLVVSTVLGVVVMFCPTWFGIDIKTRAADIAHLGGALIVTISVICMGEVIRIGRYLNVLLGLVVAGGVWLTDASTFGFALTCTILGLAAAALAVPRGQKRESYGAWDRWVR